MSVKILTLDTTNEACSAALMLDKKKISSEFIIAPKNHTKYILFIIDTLLKKAKIKLKDLNALAYCRGPGSFTGTRISVGVAQGLALGSNLPLISISSLDTLAQGAWIKTGISKILIAIYAKSKKIYFSKYQIGKVNLFSFKKDSLLSKEELFTKIFNKKINGTWTTAGNAWTIEKNIKKSKNMKIVYSKILYPNALNMLPLAYNDYCNQCFQSIESASPIYFF